MTPATHGTGSARATTVIWAAVTIVASLIVPGAGLLVAAASLLPHRGTGRRVSALLFAIAAVVLTGQVIGLAAPGPELELGPVTRV